MASALRAVKAYWKPRPSGLMDRPLPRKVKSIPGHAVCSGCWEMMGNVLQVSLGFAPREHPWIIWKSSKNWPFPWCLQNLTKHLVASFSKSRGPAKMSSERFTVFVALETPPCCILKSLWFQTHFKMIQDACHIMSWSCHAVGLPF